MWQVYVFIFLCVMMTEQKMMSEIVKKLPMMSIFAPVLKFDGQFSSKKFYIGVFTPS